MSSARNDAAPPPGPAPAGLARQLGLFDATMIVMGGMVGTGIFINPYVVARQVHTPALILGVWALGGLIAIGAAFIYAELAARLPEVGGQYAYLRAAYHPAIAFLYGWTLLLVVQTGGMAAVAVTFARYFLELTRLPLPDGFVAAAALGLLTALNCLGVRAPASCSALTCRIVCQARFYRMGPNPRLNLELSVGYPRLGRASASLGSQCGARE